MGFLAIIFYTSRTTVDAEEAIKNDWFREQFGSTMNNERNPFYFEYSANYLVSLIKWKIVDNS